MAGLDVAGLLTPRVGVAVDGVAAALAAGELAADSGAV